MCYSSQLYIQYDEALDDLNEMVIEKLNNSRNKWPEAFEQYHANAFARPMWPIISGESQEKAMPMQWGLVPNWAKDPKGFLKKANTYNAVSETVFEKPSFRTAMKNGQRCLVPVTGFYEWHHQNKLKYPHFISLKSNRVFCLAGLYENDTFSILTTSANPLMEYVHNTKRRMPVILDQSQQELWLEADLSKESVLDMCQPYPADDMQAWPVSRDITNRAKDPNSPQAHARVEYPDLPEPPPPI